MTYRELLYKAQRLINKNEITLGEYDEMTKPLDEEVRKAGKWLMPNKFYDKNIWRKCSQCNTHFELFSKYIAINGRAHYIKTEANYCKICGAKMEGEEE